MTAPVPSNLGVEAITKALTVPHLNRMLRGTTANPVGGGVYRHGGVEQHGQFSATQAGGGAMFFYGTRHRFSQEPAKRKKCPRDFSAKSEGIMGLGTFVPA